MERKSVMQNEAFFDVERAKVLLKAMCDMLDKIEASHYVENIFETTAIWDNAECDGSCWHEEAKNLLEFGV